MPIDIVTPNEFKEFGRVFDITTVESDWTEPVFTGPFKLMHLYPHQLDPESTNFALNFSFGVSPTQFFDVDTIKGFQVQKESNWVNVIPILFDSLTGDTPLRVPYLRFVDKNNEVRRFHLVYFY